MYITILDFFNGKVIIEQYDEKDPRSGEEIANDIAGHSNVQYLCTEQLIIEANTGKNG